MLWLFITLLVAAWLVAALAYTALVYGAYQSRRRDTDLSESEMDRLEGQLDNLERRERAVTGAKGD